MRSGIEIDRPARKREERLRNRILYHSISFHFRALSNDEEGRRKVLNNSTHRLLTYIIIPCIYFLYDFYIILPCSIPVLIIVPIS